MTSDWILWLHARIGMVGIFAAIWVFVEALNAREENATRTRNAALTVAVCMFVSWIAGGYWYIHFYPAERASVLYGPWPFADNVLMPAKACLFFVTLILSFYLPVVARDKLYENSTARKMVLSVSMLIVLTGLAIAASGSIVNYASRIT